MKTLRFALNDPVPFIDLETTTLEAVRTLLVLEPSVRAADGAARLIEEADSGFLAALVRSLLLQHFMRAVHAERLRQAKQRRQEQMVLPGFEHLPQMLTAENGKRLELDRATYSHFRSYLRRLHHQYRDRQARDVRIAEVNAAMKLLRKHGRRRRGLTFGEAALLESQRRADYRKKLDD